MKTLFDTIYDFLNILFAEETLYQYIGYAAAIATVAAFAIQSVRILLTKNISGLSSYMYMMYSLALICWFAYGVFIEAWPLAISNFITFFFTFTILLQIIYYDEEDKVERLRRDSLTGVFNLDYYTSYLPGVAIEARVKSEPFCIITAKIANLEAIHESMGGKYKNRALKRTAKALDNALRGDDFVARIGDNEFIIYIANLQKNSAKNVVLRVWESVNALEIRKSEKEASKVELLMGVCRSDLGGTLEDLRTKSRQALEEATSKRAVVFYAPKAEATAKKKDSTAPLKKKDQKIKEADTLQQVKASAKKRKEKAATKSK